MHEYDFFFQLIKAMYSNPGLDPLYLKTDFSKIHTYFRVFLKLFLLVPIWTPSGIFAVLRTSLFFV